MEEGGSKLEQRQINMRAEPAPPPSVTLPTNKQATPVTGAREDENATTAVSYTHLTLPTIYSV